MANEQISEITTVPTNATVIKIINTLIKRYNSLGSIYTFKGSVQTYDDLLIIQNPNVGDVYNVIEEDEEHQIAAGSNFVWDGTVWDNLGGSLAGLVQSVNGINPDSLGNVLLPLIKNISTNQGVLTITKNDNSTEQFNNIKKLYMSALGENVNLNDLTESGIYICVSNAYAANYVNCPIQKAFLLEVQATVAGNFIFQFLTQYNDGSTEAGNQYTRACYNNNWSAWRMAGSDSNLTTYTSLEQLGITPGQETFASIHNALPINSVLEYYAYFNSNFNDNFYPVTNYYGVLQAVKLNSTKTVFSFYAHMTISGNEFSELYLSAFDINFTDSRTAVWKKVALDSDLTNLSNSVVKSVNGIKPTNGNVTIDIPKPVIASEAEAKAGTNNTKFMTPLRVAQALAANNGGIVSANLAQNGYVKFANGFILQWGTVQVPYVSKNTKFNYPISLQRVFYANYISTQNGSWKENANNYLWNVTGNSMNITNTDNTSTVPVLCVVMGK